jgi:hypothetical protein
MKFTTTDILEYLNHPDFKIEGMEYSGYEISFDISPTQFLKYAETDLNSNVEHKYVNALSNAKRALDGQVTCLLDIFGLLRIAEKKHWGFPAKIESLKKIGILAPRVLNKINKTRNLLEHEFVDPKAEDVNDFIDIVSLFIEGTKGYINKYIFFIETLWREDKDILMNLSVTKEGLVAEFFYPDQDKDDSLQSVKILVDQDTNDYYEILTKYHILTEKVF